VGVRVYIGNKVADRALPQLTAQKQEIEEAIGEGLLWNPNPENRDKFIGIYRPANLWDRSAWPEVLEWLVETGGKFRKAFMPRIKKLDLSQEWNAPAER
ncbi:MAG: DUF4268 domain-containing protein, partial [Phycisphaerae bacterium]